MTFNGIESHIARKALFIILVLFNTFSASIASGGYPNGYYRATTAIDGDTFELDDGRSVRLIGIKAPEIGNDCFYEAKNRLSSLVAGRWVYLESDTTDTDRYGALLRYAYVDGLFVNETLVYDGYAYAVQNPPDTKYAAILEGAEENAQNDQRGCLWKDSPEDDARDDDDGDCIVVVAVSGSGMSDTIVRVSRNFRDRVLRKNPIGKTVVSLYYKHSPALVEFVSRHDGIRPIVTGALLPLVAVSWIALKFGLPGTFLLAALFGLVLFRLIVIIRPIRRSGLQGCTEGVKSSSVRICPR